VRNCPFNTFVVQFPQSRSFCHLHSKVFSLKAFVWWPQNIHQAQRSGCVVNGQGIPRVTATRTGINISCTKQSTIMERFHYLWVQAKAFHLDGFQQTLRCHAAAVWIPQCHLVQVHMGKALCISKCHQNGSPQCIVWSVIHHQSLKVFVTSSWQWWQHQ